VKLGEWVKMLENWENSGRWGIFDELIGLEKIRMKKVTFWTIFWMGGCFEKTWKMN